MRLQSANSVSDLFFLFLPKTAGVTPKRLAKSAKLIDEMVSDTEVSDSSLTSVSDWDKELAELFKLGLIISSGS